MERLIQIRRFHHECLLSVRAFPVDFAPSRKARVSVYFIQQQIGSLKISRQLNMIHNKCHPH